MKRSGVLVLVTLSLLFTGILTQDSKTPHSSIIELTGKNFDEVINQPDKDVFVTFYVDWCSHCNSIVPEINGVVEKYKYSKNAVIARINAERHLNIAVRFGLSGYPSLYLFSRFDRKKGEMYKGKRTTAAFIFWLEMRKFGVESVPIESPQKPQSIIVPSDNQDKKELIKKEVKEDLFKTTFTLSQLAVIDTEEPDLDDDDLVSTEDGFINTKDGEKLFWQLWETEDLKNSRGFVLIVPGLGDHSNLYLSTKDYFLKHKWNVYAFDLRGNGRSTGERGFINDWEDLRDDLYRVISFLRLKEKLNKSGSKPLFLVSHSLGGTVTLDYLSHYGSASGVKGAVVIAPLLGTPREGEFLNVLEDTIASIWPSFTLDSGAQFQAFSRDAEFQDKLQKDKLFHFDVSARLSSELRAVQIMLEKEVEKIATPVHIIHGEADTISPVVSSQTIFKILPSSIEKRLTTYPHGLHRCHDDENKVQVLTDIRVWIETLSVETQQ